MRREEGEAGMLGVGAEQDCVLRVNIAAFELTRDRSEIYLKAYSRWDFSPPQIECRSRKNEMNENGSRSNFSLR